MPGSEEHTKDRAPSQADYVKSVERGLAVIKAFNEDRPRMTIAEVAKAVGMTRGATRRFLLTLEHLGYVKTDGRYYMLSPNILELGFSYLAAQPWWRHAQRVAQALATEFGQPCAVGVLEGGSVVYLCYATAQKFYVFNRAVGTRIPAYCTAIGRVLLGELSEADFQACLAQCHIAALTPFTLTDPGDIRVAVEQVRLDGFAAINQELEIGLSSFAVPIRNRAGEVVAALSMSFRSTNEPKDSLRGRYLQRLKAAAQEISSSIVG